MSDEEKKDILFQIDMQLYDEFNDKFCEMNDNLGTVYSYKDLDDLEKLEKETEIKLLRQAIEKQSKDIEELKDINKKLEARKYMLNAETGEVYEIPIDNNYISKDKIKAEIKELQNMKVNGEVFTTSVNYAIKVLQSLLEKE